MGRAGGYDDSVAGVVACLLACGRFAGAAVDAVLRLVGRGVERAVFVPRFRLGDLPRARARIIALSRWRGSCPWRLASVNCPSCLLFAFYHCSSRRASRFSSRRASRCFCLVPDVFFLCFFSSRSPADMCLLELVPALVSSRRLVVPSRYASRAAAGRHVLA